MRSQQGNGVSHWQLSLAFPHYSIHKALSPPTRGRTVRLFLPRVLHPAERPMRAVRPIKTPNRTQLMLCDMAEDLSVYLLVCDPVWVGLIKQQFGSIMANVWNWYKVNWRIGHFKQIDAHWNWCMDPVQLSPKAYHGFVKLKTNNENLCDFQKVWFVPSSKIFRYRFHSRECFVGKGKPTEGSREGAKCLQSCHRQHDTFKTDFHSAQKSFGILEISINARWIEIVHSLEYSSYSYFTVPSCRTL